jgi:ubiquinone/menaquinone biosynthesis C-methylase UbiE
MPTREDPEGTEIKTLLRRVSFAGKEVLEVGCGEGRLTMKYFRRAKWVVAVDPSQKSIKTARLDAPKKKKNLEFRVMRAEKLGFADESFDIVFFSWSLCCVDIPAMGKALDEAWRVLRPTGTLVNLQPSLYQPFRNGEILYLIGAQFGTTVDEERYRQARFALKYASLIEGKFRLLSEKEFGINIYYGTAKEALDDFTVDCREEYKALSRAQKARVKGAIGSLTNKKGVKVVDNVVLTVLTKAEPQAVLANPRT